MIKPTQTEGDVNTSRQRRIWSEANVSPPTRDLLQRDADAFLHQSVSSPCLSIITKAEGIWIARRYVVRDQRDATQTAIVVDEVEIEILASIFCPEVGD